MKDSQNYKGSPWHKGSPWQKGSPWPDHKSSVKQRENQFHMTKHSLILDIKLVQLDSIQTD